MQGVDWIDLARYRAGSCLNGSELLGSVKCEEFITSGRTVRFTRWIMLHTVKLVS